METAKKIVQIYLKAGRANGQDWIFVDIDLLPPDRAENFAKMIEIFDRIGKSKRGYKLILPETHAKKAGFGKSESDEIDRLAFGLLDFIHEDGTSPYGPPIGSPCVIAGCYVVVLGL